MTQDLMELTLFDEVFATNDPDSPALAQYLEVERPAETVVVYVDTDEYWSSGFDAQQFTTIMIQKYGFTQKELLYAYGGSEAWKLIR